MCSRVRCVQFVLCLGVLFAYGSAVAGLTREDFFAPPDLIDISISPSGKYLAQIIEKDERRIVAIQNIKAPDTPIVGHVADKVLRHYSVSWANDERVLIKTHVPYSLDDVREHADDEDFDLDDYRLATRTVAMDPDGADVVPLLTDDHYARSNRGLTEITHYLPEFPDYILMPYFRRGRWVLAKVNVNTGKHDEVAKGGRSTFLFVSNSKGDSIYRLDFKFISDRIDIMKLVAVEDEVEWVEVDSIDFEEHRDNELLEDTQIAGLLNNELVYRKRNEETGYYEIVRYDSENDQVEALFSLEDRDVLRLVLADSTRAVVGLSYLDKVKRYKFFDEEHQKQYDKMAKHFEDKNFFVTSSTASRGRSIIYSYGPNDPGTYYLYSRKTDNPGLIGHRYTDLTKEQLGIPVDAHYEARDGTPIHAYLLLPPDYQQNRKYPLVMMPHGGPQAQDWAYWDKFAQFLATRGYIVMKPNFRGSTGYGLEFERAGYKEWGGLIQNDITDAVFHMFEEDLADPDRVCIVGGSFGGYAALMGLIQTPTLFKCAVSINGVTHLPEQVEHDEENMRDEALVERFVYERIGHPDEDEAMLRHRSPVFHADRVQGELLIIAGREDDNVPVEQSELMVEALEDHGKEYQYIELEDAGHNVFNNRRNSKRLYREIEEFLAKHLDVQDEAEKASQGEGQRSESVD